MPDNATSLYESLCKQVLEGAVRPQRLSVFLYHGMLRGLQIFGQDLVRPEVLPSRKEEPFLFPVASDDNLVCLLANMILQLEVKHAY